ETGRMGGAGRREIGHGKLAWRAIRPMLPTSEDFPYTIRIVSEITESNGSSSMASVCGASLALMDAGVPLTRPVSGIAMGLILEPSGEFAILSDILGDEDFLGDMDFKVAGTREGITALQMDIKIKGLSRDILARALAQAKKSYLYIMDKMTAVIAEPRPELSKYAPRIITMHIHPDKIRDVIGAGGKMISKTGADNGTEIDIDPDGTVYIAAVNPNSGAAAVKKIEALTTEVEVGEVYMDPVTRVEKSGASAEKLPGK